MAQTSKLLLFFSLLQVALSRTFSISMPKVIKILQGSCVTIPCSFDIEEKYDTCLQSLCEAQWSHSKTQSFKSRSPTSPIKGNLTGNLMNKDCTTTLFAPSPAEYTFRLECGDCVKANFDPKVRITEEQPTPTLSQSTLTVNDGTSVNLTCSVSVFCVFNPPNLTWTPDIGYSQETLREDQSGIQVKSSTLTFTASHLHHGKNIFCSATFSNPGGIPRTFSSTVLSANVSLAPQILPSSECTNSAGQVKCFCEAIGNPSPNLLWYLNGFPINDSMFSISHMSLSGTQVKSVITTNQQEQLDDLSKLLCRSTNTLGSASQQFCVPSFEKEIPSERQGLSDVMMPVLIAAVAILLLLVCALLFVIRTKKSQQNLPKKFSCKCDTNTVSTNHLETNRDLNEEPNPTEEDIYVNRDVLRQAAKANTTIPGRNTESSEPEQAKRNDKSSEDGDVVYSLVSWKSVKGTVGKGAKVTEQPGSYYLLEESSMEGGMSKDFVSTAMEMGNLYDEVGHKNVKREAECEYAQVNVQSKNAM